MNWLLTALLCIILVEVALRLPLPDVMHAFGRITRKATHTLQSKHISDHWKEKVMVNYSVTLMIQTLKLAAILTGVLLLAAVLIYLFDHFGATVGDFILGWVGITYSVAAAMLYLKLRKKFV